MEHQKASSAKWNMMDIKRQADEFDKKEYNMRTNRLSNINDSTSSFESNLLSSIVRFDRIDAAMIMIIN